VIEGASDEICSFVSIERYWEMPKVSDSPFLATVAHDIEGDAHLASSLSTFDLLLECSINCLRLLADNLGLIDENNTGGEYNVQTAVVDEQTFSIANSSSALTLISRAFSSASCLMNATYERTRTEGMRVACRRALLPSCSSLRAPPHRSWVVTW